MPGSALVEPLAELHTDWYFVAPAAELHTDWCFVAPPAENTVAVFALAAAAHFLYTLDWLNRIHCLP